jgi:hypothetical protein
MHAYAILMGFSAELLGLFHVYEYMGFERFWRQRFFFALRGCRMYLADGTRLGGWLRCCIELAHLGLLEALS